MAVAPAGKVAMVSATAPVPLAVQVAPPAAAQLQLWAVMPAGIGSLTVVPSAATVPLFVTTTVSVSYTHLDVYKRQDQEQPLPLSRLTQLRAPLLSQGRGPSMRLAIA